MPLCLDYLIKWFKLFFKIKLKLFSELKVVTYVNKKKESINYPLSSALESNNKVIL